MVKSADSIEESEQKQDGDDPKRPHETPEEREKAKIARFSQYVLNPEAFGRSPNLQRTKESKSR